MDRRRFLAAAAGSGVATAVAGCLASASPSPPDVPEDRLESDGWGLVEEEKAEAFSESIAGAELTATATTRTYENEPLRSELAEKTLGEVTDAPVSFFASRITFDPDLTDLPGGVGGGQILDEVETNVRATLEAQMAAHGVEEIEKVGTDTLTVDAGMEARQTDLEGVVPFEPVSFPAADGAPVAIEMDDIVVVGRMAVWRVDGSVLVGGGAFPAENVETSVEEDLSSAISVAIDVDLGLEPDRYAEDLFDLIRAIE
ncbi:twin-arginine translocation signal domain-containing protein [Halorubrum vacuolatum]|nr:twin-arginine translocation signal domain-containing protein [Halorubrum vacuolatum]